MTSPLRTLAPGARAGGSIGSPTIITTRVSRGSLRPRARMRSLPPIPIGTIGTPMRAATKATPWCRSSTTGPDRRVPSGNMPRGSPPESAASAARMAARSAPLRSTGKPPSAERKVADQPYFQSSALPMNRIRRRVTQARNGVSRNDRWEGASTQAPLAGTRSLCTTLIRHRSLHTPSTSARTKP